MNERRRQDNEGAGRTVALPERGPARGRSRRRPVVMIADDTRDTRELYAEHFRMRGFTVLTAQDGATAIDTAIQHRPDVVVMDLALPQFDGLTAIRKIKEDRRARRARVILLTGYPRATIPRLAAEAGVDRYILKPCLPDDLERHVNELRRPRGRSTVT